MIYGFSKFGFRSPQKQTFCFLQIFRTACVVYSHSNVGQVHCFLTGVSQKIFRSCEKNPHINTHNIIYKPQNALNKMKKITNIMYHSSKLSTTTCFGIDVTNARSLLNNKPSRRPPNSSTDLPHCHHQCIKIQHTSG
jgi:hypothetical protein